MSDQLRRQEPILAVVGPTASGKTATALALAQEFGGELVGADSVQVYRGFDIGSAKPNAAELAGIAHHMIDIAEADQPIDAAEYAALADTAIDSVFERGRVPIVVGGTGLWLRALLRGLVELPKVDPGLRAELSREADTVGVAAMHNRLREVDPLAAENIHANDRVRILRALEVHRQTGRPLGELQREHSLGGPRYNAHIYVLWEDPDVLTARIVSRTDTMLRLGFRDEVARLLARFGPDVRALGSVGYREMVAHVAGNASMEETRTRIVQSTRIYARRQRTWWNNEPGVRARTTAQNMLSAASFDLIRSHLNK